MSAEDLKVGKLIQTVQERDAIHVAIMPVLALEDLTPGQHVGWNGHGAKQTEAPIGVVDPFLKEDVVEKGQKFWLFLYPGSITSLRHDWTHPIINDAHVKWLKEFANMIGQTYDQLMANAEEFVETGEYVGMGSNENYHNADSQDWLAFWHHYKAVTGKKGPSDQDDEAHAFFTCAC